MQRHRHQEFIRLQKRLEREIGQRLHVVVADYAAQNKDKVRKRLARHPRWEVNGPPTACSGPNALAGFFATLTGCRLKHGDFRPGV